MTDTLKVGALVRLDLPENLRLHGALAMIESLTEYGAHVKCDAAGSGRFRALFSEMMPYAQVNGPKRAAVQARDEGYSGDACDTCGSFRMKRNGSCLACCDCGSTSGCS